MHSCMDATSNCSRSVKISLQSRLKQSAPDIASVQEHAPPSCRGTNANCWPMHRDANQFRHQMDIAQWGVHISMGSTSIAFVLISGSIGKTESSLRKVTMTQIIIWRAAPQQGPHTHKNPGQASLHPELVPHMIAALGAKCRGSLPRPCLAKRTSHLLHSNLCRRVLHRVPSEAGGQPGRQ